LKIEELGIDLKKSEKSLSPSLFLEDMFKEIPMYIHVWAILRYIGLGLCLIIGVLLAVAYFTQFERKAMASMQRRKGPNVVGF
jgi:NADH:ubiquinone oxidoreductase subunit H